MKKLQYLVTIEAFGHHSTDWYTATSRSAALKKALAAKGVRIEIGSDPVRIEPKEVRP